MGPAAGAAESKEPLQGLRVKPDGHLEAGGEPEPRANSSKCNYKKREVVIAVSIAVVLGLIALFVLAWLRPKLPSADLGPPAVSCCPEDWVGYGGKCYYFSETEGNWTYSRSQCSALNASLAGINSEQDLDFLLRYKGKPDHWLGLQRDPGQLWKWTNGTEFNNLFVIGGGGDCAYLNDENRVSSLRCTSKRHWICTKPNEFTKAQEDAVEGG
ncbi:C-type lectin domain family 2 member E-like isoform X1 [Dermochelys coriacea]|uniref:C-type lectin domain family 2 member E-like isoform X1 n=1 Tax=Dermochelys coriacea TaxID=27794 RepID=UPI0018E7E23D|nr:C-type lectin domain family 2 member E-like isoform X1 [Dermochelys coriacea]